MIENGSTDIDKSTKITKISVFGLILSFGVLFLDIGNVDKNTISYAAFHGIANVLIGRVLFQSNWNIWLCANFLGYSFVAGIMLATRSKVYCSLGYYIVLMSTFHYMEFITSALTNPANLSVHSYLLPQSGAYVLAALASWIEYAIEFRINPDIKRMRWFGASGIGVMICIVGDLIRKIGMFHAGANFNHIIQETKTKEHELITNGIYSFVRHPSYLGWFLFSMGTQLILCNPISFFVYIIITWRFFSDRIYVEESLLLQFFGKEYSEYQKSVPYTGVPFVRGFTRSL